MKESFHVFDNPVNNFLQLFTSFQESRGKNVVKKNLMTLLEGK